jgi:hypothetical protein
MYFERSDGIFTAISAVEPRMARRKRDAFRRES